LACTPTQSSEVCDRTQGLLKRPESQVTGLVYTHARAPDPPIVKANACMHEDYPKPAHGNLCRPEYRARVHTPDMLF